MYYAAMRKFDIANGPGIRSTLFVSGCTHHCKGCFNELYKDFLYGKRWDEESKEMFLQYATDPNVHGVTILGGEPFDQTKDEDLLTLLKLIKAHTNHTIWMYSGYVFEAILKDVEKVRLLAYCDVLVDGPFIEALKDITLKFRGSSNQRIIDVQRSLSSNTVILVET